MGRADQIKKYTVDRRTLLYHVPLFIAFVLIVTPGILYHQSFIKILPALISLAVNLFAARVNRVSFLIGAANCLIYSIGYFEEGLYGSVANALCYSMPLQLISYATWRKNKYGNARTVKVLSMPKRALSAAALVILSALSAFVLSRMSGSNQSLLDGTIFALGLFSTVFIMLGYVEGAVIHVVSAALGVVMWSLIVSSGKMENITYAVLGVYTLYMSVLSLINWIGLYRTQLTEKERRA